MKKIPVLLALLLAAGVAHADGLTVINGDFQQAGPMTYQCLAPATCSWNGGPVPGWTLTDGPNSGGSQLSGNAMFTSIPGDGPVTIWLNYGSLEQTLNTGLTPDTTYDFSVWVGHRLPDSVAAGSYPLVPNDPGANLTADFSISLTAGGTTLASLTGNNGTIPAGTFQLETLTYTTGSVVPSGNVGVVLSTSGPQVDFADDTLVASPTPEPASLMLFGSGMLGMMGLFAKKLLA